MRKIVYAVYHDCNKEARSMELLKCCQLMGSVHLVSFAAPLGVDGISVSLIDKSSPFALFNFLKKAKKVIKAENPDIVVLHDNDCSALIPFVKKKFPSAKIVYDSSELYISEGTRKKKSSNGLKIKIKAKLTSFRKKYEKKYLKRADVVLAANEERAEIMKRYFSLSETPIVFDNIHRIDDAFDECECEKKFGYAFDESKFNILFAGGINEERETFSYIDAFAKVKDGKRLVIVGAASAVARARYDKMIVNMGLSDDVVYLGFVTRAQLRYCMTRSQASVVIFDKDSYNTKYCASGKCYESLFEGVPILASENPPLKRLCDTYKIGVSNDRFDEAMNIIKDNYEFYCNGVKEYVGALNYDSRVGALAAAIERKIK